MAPLAAVIEKHDTAETVMLTRGPFAGAQLRVKCVGDDGTVTGHLVNPLVVVPGEYLIPDA